MDFIERWLHISPDNGNGASELLIVAIMILTIFSVIVRLRGHLPKRLIEYLERLGNREGNDRFDN